MRAISLMYELSGGCDYGHKCSDCKHFEYVTKKDAYGKKKDIGVCYRHPLREPYWKPDYTACKWWKSQYTRAAKNKEGQCEGQLDLDLFL